MSRGPNFTSAQTQNLDPNITKSAPNLYQIDPSTSVIIWPLQELATANRPYHKECQVGCQIDCQIKCQKECQKNCQIECQIKCQIEIDDSFHHPRILCHFSGHFTLYTIMCHWLRHHDKGVIPLASQRSIPSFDQLITQKDSLVSLVSQHHQICTKSVPNRPLDLCDHLAATRACNSK